MNWMCTVVPIGMVIYSKIRYDTVKFECYTLGLMLGMVTFRVFIIAIRHGTTPPRVYRDMYTGPISYDNVSEGFMLTAWTIINEENLTKEITKSLLSNEVFQDFFDLKVFLPIYPPMRKRLQDDNAYADIKWNSNEMEKKDKA